MHELNFYIHKVWSQNNEIIYCGVLNEILFFPLSVWDITLQLQLLELYH